jgi:hypothetical protein
MAHIADEMAIGCPLTTWAHFTSPCSPIKRSSLTTPRKCEPFDISNIGKVSSDVLTARRIRSSELNQIGTPCWSTAVWVPWAHAHRRPGGLVSCRRPSLLGSESKDKVRTAYCSPAGDGSTKPSPKSFRNLHFDTASLAGAADGVPFVPGSSAFTCRQTAQITASSPAGRVGNRRMFDPSCFDTGRRWRVPRRVGVESRSRNERHTANRDHSTRQGTTNIFLSPDHVQRDVTRMLAHQSDPAPLAPQLATARDPERRSRQDRSTPPEPAVPE